MQHVEVVLGVGARAVAVQPDIILLSAVSSARSEAARLLRFEKGLEHVLFLVDQQGSLE